jgi:23S rRNA (cytidine1920-2'-O)/16S rRNA (cytidine1409-2'-O)-methyltransferase
VRSYVICVTEDVATDASTFLVVGRKTRLDTLLTDRGLFDSRSRAAAAILAGGVLLGPGREQARKPGTPVSPDVQVTLAERPRYVSRGGLKLENALRALRLPVSGRHCLDVGASTGGFADCLLQAGAAHVVALDVGYGQLDWRLRNDERVTVIERRNARYLEPDDLPYAPQLITVDVSFIGLSKLLPALARCAAKRFDLLALVKPQFELGPERVGKGGVVRSAEDRLDALVAAGEAAREARLSVHGYAASGLPGPEGNRESFVWCAEADRQGVDDLRRAARAAESDTRSEIGTPR